MSQVENLITQHLDIWTQATEAKSTAGRGTRGKINLLGIQKLRELILEMAVRGLLVPQDPNDEPASELLKKIAAEKAQLIKDGKIKKSKPLPDITDDEKPFELPVGWEWVRLGEVGTWAIGSGFPKKLQGIEGAEVLFSKVSDMNLEGNEKYLITTVNTITNEIAAEHKIKVHQKGTVIFPKIGGAIATNKRRIIAQPAAIDNNCLGITPTVGISSDYLYLYLQSLDLTAYQAGTSVPALSQATLELISLGLPPIAEQTRIVAKVDELMALCDALEAQTLDSIATHQTLVETLLGSLVNPDNSADSHQAWLLIEQNFDVLFTTEHSIDTLKQTILQLAVMGKLVPQDPNDEPASELLKKIAAEKAQLIKDGKIKKSKPLPPITDNEKPFDLPNGWVAVRLKDLVSVLGDGIHGTPSYDEKGDYFFVNGNNLIEEAIQIKPDTKKVNKSEYEKHKKPLCERTLLVSINGTLGKVGFYAGEKVMLGKSACYFNLLEEIDKLFISKVLQAPYFQDYAIVSATGSTIKNLSLNSMNNFVVYLPPLAEQGRIVAKVNQLMTLCDQIKTQLQAAQHTQAQLAQSITQEALS